MAQIDVTELMTDPDFVDEICLVTRTSQVNSRGENIIHETSIKTVGSVQPATGKALQRLPEAMRLENISSFWVKGLIVTSIPGKYSSILVFKNQRYQVKTVQDWSNFGEGYCEGTCIAEVPAP